MTCKDCIHYDVCHRRINSIDFLPFVKGKVSTSSIMYKNCDDVEKHCRHYKDKSRIVELPCKEGENLYYISNKNTIGCFLNVSYETILMCVNDYHNGEIKFMATKREECEAKLKELNKNVDN